MKFEMKFNKKDIFIFILQLENISEIDHHIKISLLSLKLFLIVFIQNITLTTLFRLFNFLNEIFKYKI